MVTGTEKIQTEVRTKLTLDGNESVKTIREFSSFVLFETGNTQD